MTLNINSDSKSNTPKTSKIKNSTDGMPVLKKENTLTHNTETDKVEISDMAKKLQEMEAEKQMLREMYAQSEEQSENAGYDDMSKALAIFRRIIKGDKVPPKDEKFLMEYDPDMYMQALTFKEHNNKPKKHKSLLKEENTDKSTNKIETSTDNMPMPESSASVDTPEASGEIADSE